MPDFNPQKTKPFLLPDPTASSAHSAGSIQVNLTYAREGKPNLIFNELNTRGSGFIANNHHIAGFAIRAGYIGIRLPVIFPGVFID